MRITFFSRNFGKFGKGFGLFQCGIQGYQMILDSRVNDNYSQCFYDIQRGFGFQLVHFCLYQFSYCSQKTRILEQGSGINWKSLQLQSEAQTSEQVDQIISTPEEAVCVRALRTLGDLPPSTLKSHDCLGLGSPRS